MAKTDKPSIPSVLAFEKKLVPSDAQLFAVSWENRNAPQGLKLQEKSVRGTISNRLKTAKEADPAKLDASIENANIQTVDYCALPNDKDTLKVRFTLKVLSGVQTPSACNGQDFQKTYAQAVQAYIAKTQFKELAQRYATNIANARFLWRNRVGAEQIQVVVKHINSSTDKPTVWMFDAKTIGLQAFDAKAVQGLAQVIADSLSGNTEFALLDIEAYSQLGEGQEVYPSEELVTEKGNKSKILYETDGIAALHSQKVGNALRTIDTWYASDARPIAVEVYGSVTNQGTAYRKPTDKQDFYTLFDKFALGEKAEENQEHYVMAMLVRGGVFGQSSK
ncbi:MAG: type I-F CRISPR-associated protein Csy3 [Candidatus Thiocaldithrix dubininis]|uniref:Type I-F CRISPR-associated protein Csy3 n=1 Tax=Candidatus Thiocaldithrix dubininis TaxID=3080823 RepID=A0AA95KH85_9GAMM|nr:MAG: type I-F CRISPR-associated protein Csy3 [Candidatus Thiocaldithrix dubininis]